MIVVPGGKPPCAAVVTAIAAADVVEWLPMVILPDVAAALERMALLLPSSCICGCPAEAAATQCIGLAVIVIELPRVYDRASLIALSFGIVASAVRIVVGCCVVGVVMLLVVLVFIDTIVGTDATDSVTCGRRPAAVVMKEIVGTGALNDVVVVVNDDFMATVG